MKLLIGLMLSLSVISQAQNLDNDYEALKKEYLEQKICNEKIIKIKEKSITGATYYIPIKNILNISEHLGFFWLEFKGMTKFENSASDVKQIIVSKESIDEIQKLLDKKQF